MFAPEATMIVSRAGGDGDQEMPSRCPAEADVLRLVRCFLVRRQAMLPERVVSTHATYVTAAPSRARRPPDWPLAAPTRSETGPEHRFARLRQMRLNHRSTLRAHHDIGHEIDTSLAKMNPTRRLARRSPLIYRFPGSRISHHEMATQWIALSLHL